MYHQRLGFAKKTALRACRRGSFRQFGLRLVSTNKPSSASKRRTEHFRLEEYTQKIEQLVLKADEDTRRRTKVALSTLVRSLDDTNDTIHWLGYLHLKTAAVRLGFNLGLFRLLSATEADMSLDQIATQTEADSAFLRRLLSYLSSIDVIQETGKNRYGATNTTRNLSEEVAEAGISHCFETVGPLYQSMPSYFASNKYRVPDDERATVFQKAFQTSQHCFRWLGERRELLGFFNKYMALRRGPELSWLSVYPVAQHISGVNKADRVLYVDVGGGIGHQCREFRERFPNLSGRVILQDLPHTISKAFNTPGVENMAHDFFEEQPVKGASFYFLRGVCHNHPDQKVKLLLRRLRDAMTTESILILDEWVLPDVGVNSYAASMDLVMMAACAGEERTEARWHRIFAETGLEKYVYNPVSYESVMEVTRA